MTHVELKSQTPIAPDILNIPDIPFLKELLRQSDSIVHPSMLQINTRVLLNELSKKYGRPLTLAQLPDDELARITDGFDMIWFMGIYEPSTAARNSALNYIDEYRGKFPDLDPDDVVASPFAVHSYSPSPDVATSWQEWDERIVQRLHSMNKKVVLDFVPNHVAPDHQWVNENPEYVVTFTPEEAQNYNQFEYELRNGPNGDQKAIAHGKDGLSFWTDTVQLNYANPDLQESQLQQALELSRHCDGVRCDMAHLMLSNAFERN
ncbi:hypothetical protein A3A93_05460 [Candidatus Roizmanbacteria bacterium RIFCSPLOWO2_01_FULL_38_12]|uniref:Uncharacterized protein n=1 Tax=Candidatus Roizmanbacteria bacterium RIFCSPLOWO2_01_FULL_38_12 TaxID=1802061 RepID=A0A1F7IZ53_9BACT|nr:MAG: hypothetical protein A2861_03675 [Candidatus Roizmanbacteria bacterium RIFCSPHIGHO2_01_FULL_38_15]OGK35255.1 MAG: hypothetical protein A3F59_06350 [Candidatus Roizmanbacteria bacterium RIFCSPHIGHO2_12_FULL_38_13]OGK48634.1 MAG: hypothetical protein A3A93_05460 [Candidatus Roizmanbacteria bacterium RIFCSPLOWO2_01_FULL_38_12]